MTEKSQNLTIGIDRVNNVYYAYVPKFRYTKPCGKKDIIRFYFKARMSEMSKEQARTLAFSILQKSEMESKYGKLMLINDKLELVKPKECKTLKAQLEEKPMIKETQKIIADARSSEAHYLLDKYVDGSLSYSFTTFVTGELVEITYDSQTPFKVKDSTGKVWYFTFIRQGSEPLKPYCIADKLVRAKLMGRTFMSKSGNVTSIVTRIENADGSWKINGSISAARLLNEFVWIDKDGIETPCGIE